MDQLSLYIVSLQLDANPLPSAALHIDRRNEVACSLIRNARLEYGKTGEDHGYLVAKDRKLRQKYNHNALEFTYHARLRQGSCIITA